MLSAYTRHFFDQVANQLALLRLRLSHPANEAAYPHKVAFQPRNCQRRSNPLLIPKRVRGVESVAPPQRRLRDVLSPLARIVGAAPLRGDNKSRHRSRLRTQPILDFGRGASLRFRVQPFLLFAGQFVR